MAERFDKIIDSLIGLTGLILAIFLLIAGSIIPGHNFFIFPDGLLHATKDVFRDTGISVLIMVGIATTLDRRHRMRFIGEVDDRIEKFKGNSFQALFGWFIPNEYLNEVEKQLFRTSFIRESGEIVYTLRSIPDDIKSQIDKTCDFHNERIIMEVTMTSKIRNIKLEHKPYTVKCYVEKEDAPNFNHVYLVNVTDREGHTRTYNEDQLKGYLDSADKINNSYELPERVLRPDESIEVEVRYRTIRSYNHTREVFLCLLMTKEFTIRVNCAVPGLSIYCEAIGPQPVHEIPSSDSGSAYCTEKCWRIFKPLLPHQGIMLWWQRDKEITETSDHKITA